MKSVIWQSVLTPSATILLVVGTTFTATQTPALDHVCAIVHCQKEAVAKVPNDLYVPEDDIAESLEPTSKPLSRSKKDFETES